jgi:hypothetical protein
MRDTEMITNVPLVLLEKTEQAKVKINPKP